jgi:hypothetical protein
VGDRKGGGGGRDRRGPVGAGAVEAASAPAPAPARDLTTPAGFASEVLAAAQAVPDAGRFVGSEKVFIASAYDAYVQRTGHVLSLDRFKDRLVEANRLGLLSLARADLVEAMDPEQVRRSFASAQPGATTSGARRHDQGAYRSLPPSFHFIRARKGS